MLAIETNKGFRHPLMGAISRQLNPLLPILHSLLVKDEPTLTLTCNDTALSICLIGVAMNFQLHAILAKLSAIS